MHLLYNLNLYYLMLIINYFDQYISNRDLFQNFNISTILLSNFGDNNYTNL